MNLQIVEKAIQKNDFGSLLNCFTAFLDKSGMSKEKQGSFATDAIALFTKTPKLLTCSPASLLGGFLTSAQLGLSLNPAAQLTYLIPYGNDAQFQLGYRGMIALAKRTYPKLMLFFECIFEGEKYEWSPDGQTILHKKRFDRDMYKDKVIGVYCYGNLDSQILPTLYLSKGTLDNFQNRSKSKNTWGSDYVAMSYAKIAKQYLSRSLMVEGIEQNDEVVHTYNEQKETIEHIPIYDDNFLVAGYLAKIRNCRTWESVKEIANEILAKYPHLQTETKAAMLQQKEFLPIAIELESITNTVELELAALKELRDCPKLEHLIRYVWNKQIEVLNANK